MLQLLINFKGGNQNEKKQYRHFDKQVKYANFWLRLLL